MHKVKPARLILENGVVFHGKSFGSDTSSSGEVVFNTSMVGYPESLTDPSSEGQILIVTYPIIGNYGVPPKGFTQGISDFFESNKIHVKGLVVSEYSHNYSHWNAEKSLSDWLKEEGVPAIYGIDTRALTKLLRENGTMRGKIIYDEDDIELISYSDLANSNLVADASCETIVEYKNGDKKLVVVDCGIKHSILRYFRTKDIHVIRVPWDFNFNTIDYDGLFISNGPGNPENCKRTIENIRLAMNKDKPIFGVGLGHQLISLAAGANIYKLKNGHHGSNQPIRKVGENRCFITSQNHDYAVDFSLLSNEWNSYFENMNDGTNEGIIHKTKPFSSVQFYPETSEYSVDTKFLYENFIDKL